MNLLTKYFSLPLCFKPINSKQKEKSLPTIWFCISTVSKVSQSGDRHDYIYLDLINKTYSCIYVANGQIDHAVLHLSWWCVKRTRKITVILRSYYTGILCIKKVDFILAWLIEHPCLCFANWQLGEQVVHQCRW